MPREKHWDLRAAGLIREAEQFADALRLIALGLDAMEIRQGGAVTACANGISQRLAELKKLCGAS